jgi:hypothetical protein
MYKFNRANLIVTSWGGNKLFLIRPTLYDGYYIAKEFQEDTENEMLVLQDKFNPNYYKRVHEICMIPD